MDMSAVTYRAGDAGRRRAVRTGNAGLAAVLLLCATTVVAADAVTIRMATTTSTENSGLLKYLLPMVEKETGVTVQVIAVGSGRAIKLAENGDVDLLMSHAPEAEKELVAKGFARERRELMYNDFVVVGSPSDPAGAAGRKSARECFAGIAESGSVFVSRGDDSGTHKKELELWKSAGSAPKGRKWYLEAGQGMEPVLMMASEKRGYTLTDRATLAAVARKVDLKILCEGDPALFNPYAVMVVNPDKHPHVKHEAATRCMEWLLSDRGLKAITDFRADGKQVFFAFSSVAGKGDVGAKTEK